MNEPDFDERKARTVERHLRGVQRFEQRRENLAEKKRRGGRPPRRQRNEDEDWEADDLAWEEGRRSRGEPPTRSRADAASAGHSSSAVAETFRVSQVARTEVRVLASDGSERAASLTPAILASGGVVVGDRVELDSRGRVAVRASRYSLLQRRAPGQAHRSKLIAANVDVGLIVLAPRESGLSLGFLDRALAALLDGEIEPVVVVTKADLLGGEEARLELLSELAPWTAVGYSVHLIASPTGEGIDELREEVAGKVTVLFGHSGVGKSTLVNALDPCARQVTGAVREEDGRGRHTTTSSRLIPFGDGGAIVDTPGIRQLVPEVRDPAELAAAIPELAPYLGRCRFADCDHGGEQDVAVTGCAVTAAAESDPVVASALRRWRRLLETEG
ncbi:MAG: ribosome small subunit-dependent GTPase A [Planctomycetota bacterium]